MKRKGWKRKIISFLAVIVATLAMNESTVFANEDTRDCAYVSKEGSRKAALYKEENKNC